MRGDFLPYRQVVHGFEASMGGKDEVQASAKAIQAPRREV